ncbi:MAG TPA: CehA/McbA family metallohydrolase [Bacillota bacterium]|nr:CehA/McbA family metallohydrolase [Bacillota bacterium]HOA15494.1 CehA/McbA family metallohydrolase [Bacillota bacterium]
MRNRALCITALIMLFLAATGAAAASGTAVPEFNYYFGNLHAHTSYSDGMGTPTDAYKKVSGAGDMDFFSLTEHGYYFQEITNIHLWYKSHEEADAFYRPGEFVPLVGYEWTHSEGHMNGYGTPKAASRDTQRDFTAFIEYLHEFNGIATFNHPNPEIQPNWNDFSYWAYADDVVSMIEVGSGAYYRNTRNEPSYIKALDRGWKVGAVNNQDNHRDDWGTAAPVRTGIVARELNRDSIMDAMRNMRTYSTEDKNARALIWSGEYVMGDTMLTNGPAIGREFEIEVYAEDPDGDLYSKIELITNGGRVVSAVNAVKGGTFSFRVTTELDYSYFYARMTQADGDRIITTPIWIETGAGVVASDFRIEDAFIVKGKQASFYARIADRTGESPAEVGYELYSDQGSGFEKKAEGSLSITPGRWAHLTIPWVPSSEGQAALKLVIMTASGPQSFMAGLYEVMEKEPMRLAVDEGHNNRLTSYYSSLLGLAKQAGYDGSVLVDIIRPDYLKGLNLIVLPMPEQGFALTPTYYEDAEIEALAEWVKQGGSLMLMGWGDAGDGSRDPRDFNRLLEKLGVGASFAGGMLLSGEALALTSIVTTPLGEYKVAFTEGCALKIADGSQWLVHGSGASGNSATIDGTRIEDPYFLAAYNVGRGRVVLAGSVLFSDYELKKDGFDNRRLAVDLLAWLMEGRWQ